MTLENFILELIKIENISGKNEKRKSLEVLSQSPEAKILLSNILNPRFSTYIGEDLILGAIRITGQDSDYQIELPIDLTQINNIYQKLNNGEIKRGHSAIAIIKKIQELMPTYSEWISRIFRKDLRIWVEWHSFSKVNNIQKFSVLLANDINKVKNIEKKLNFPLYIQPKLDGYRCVAIYQDSEWKLFSRNGKEYKNFPQIIEKLNQYANINFVYDGEIMSDDFMSMQQTAFSDKKKRVVGDLFYAVFDRILLTDWQEQKSATPFFQRFSAINEFEELNEIKLVRTIEINDLNQISEFHQQFVTEGYEGLMIRNNTPYEWKRTDNLIKVKDMKTMDCRILDVQYGSNKFTDRMGAILVLQENGIECLVGGGFSDEERLHFIQQKQELIGKIIEVKYQELTEHNCMRFPVFLRFRPDLDEEENA